MNRTIICIVAYQAESHIEQVLRRLPKEIWDSEKYHVLLSDDASYITATTLHVDGGMVAR